MGGWLDIAGFQFAFCPPLQEIQSQTLSIVQYHIQRSLVLPFHHFGVQFSGLFWDIWLLLPHHGHTHHAVLDSAVVPVVFTEAKINKVSIPSNTESQQRAPILCLEMATRSDPAPHHTTPSAHFGKPWSCVF